MNTLKIVAVGYFLFFCVVFLVLGTTSGFVFAAKITNSSRKMPGGEHGTHDEQPNQKET